MSNVALERAPTTRAVAGLGQPACRPTNRANFTVKLPHRPQTVGTVPPEEPVVCFLHGTTLKEPSGAARRPTRIQPHARGKKGTAEDSMRLELYELRDHHPQSARAELRDTS
jgi:hypothetical protein